MKIAVIGCGTVGSALVNWLKQNTRHEVVRQDPGKGLNEPLRNIHAAFICVPSATNDDRTQDLRIIDTWVNHLAFHCVPIFIRSTVLPGTCDNLGEKHTADVYAMPEFLTARFAEQDFERHPIVCGGRGSGNDALPELLGEMFPGKTFHYVSNIEAELSKYTHNVFGAMKVNYFNIIAELCLKMRANYDKVIAAARITGFIEPEHTKVPGPDGSFGFGGACLPKDLKAFIGLLQEQGVIGSLTLIHTEENNAYFRAKGKGDTSWATSSPASALGLGSASPSG